MSARTALILLLVLVGCSKSSGGFDKAPFCADLRTASASASYQHSYWLAMAKDGPIPGDDGFSAGDAAWNAYGAWGDSVGGSNVATEQLARHEFQRRASVFLVGWCGD